MLEIRTKNRYITTRFVDMFTADELKIILQRRKEYNEARAAAQTVVEAAAEKEYNSMMLSSTMLVLSMKLDLLSRVLSPLLSPVLSFLRVYPLTLNQKIIFVLKTVAVQPHII